MTRTHSHFAHPRFAWAALAIGLSACATAQPVAHASAQLELSPCRPDGMAEDARCGVFVVPENRAIADGRTLPLRVIVLPARTPRPDATPIFFFSGGPGQAATDSVADLAQSWERDEQDAVFIDMRGTGEGNRLDCDDGISDATPQAYLEPIFSNAQTYAACRDTLAARADLTQYTTEIAARDIDEARQALGYDQINLYGISYGTRSALAYVNFYGEHVRSAFLSGLSTISNRNPLYHAAAAQRALEQVASQCAADAACHGAFPDVLGDLAAIRARLSANPARVTIINPIDSAPVELTLTESAFTDGLRVMLYSARSGRAVPYLMHRARDGDFAPFATAALASNRNLTRSLRLGLMLSVVCSEDAPRIRDEEIPALTDTSFIGARRVRNQLAACRTWPHAAVSPQFLAPFTSDIPTLLISGNLDPVTPPSWGEDARRGLTNSVHIVTPGAHGEGGECVENAARTLFRTGAVTSIDTSCASALTLPPFQLSEATP